MTAMNPSINPAANATVNAGAAQSSIGSVRLPSRLAPPDDVRTPFGTQVRVEIRKLVNTRAGKWLLAGIIAVTAAITIGAGVFANRTVTAESGDAFNFDDIVVLATGFLAFLLPIVGILAVTSEWSQRTGLVTFTLEPKRTRIGAAKLAASLLLAAGVLAGTFATAALATAIRTQTATVSPEWGLSAAQWAGIVIGQFALVCLGVALGLCIQNTPFTIVAYLLVPIALGLLTVVPVVKHVVEWINYSVITDNLAGGDSSDNGWAKLAVVIGVWVFIPVIIGLVRLNRSEIK